MERERRGEMNCEKARELLLEGSRESAELKAHLVRCPDCASLARQWSALAPLRPAPMEPPTALDLKICSFAAHTVNERRSRRRLFKMLAGVGAAAAVVAMTVTVSLVMPDSQKSARASGIIEWDTVSLVDDLISLESEIDAAKAALGSVNRREPRYSRPDYDSSMQLVTVEVPEFIT